MKDIEQIITIVKNAGGLVMQYYGTNPKVSTKPDSTLVTVADLASDKYIRSELHKLFPKDKILSEETENTIKDYSGRVWIVDPLDGTRIFTLNGKGFSTVIGLCQDGVPILGVIYAPAQDILFYAKKGEGAFMKDKSGITRLIVKETKRLSQGVGMIKPGTTNLSKMSIPQIFYDNGAALMVMDVARGKLDLHLEATFKASKWDVCASQIILEESGGKLTDLKGNPIDYKNKASKLENSYIATNNFIHTEALKEIKKLHY